MKLRAELRQEVKRGVDSFRLLHVGKVVEHLTATVDLIVICVAPFLHLLWRFSLRALFALGLWHNVGCRFSLRVAGVPGFLDIKTHNEPVT